MNTIHFKINGLTCEACAELVIKRINKIPGVDTVQIDFENGNTGNAEVRSQDALDLATIQNSLVGTDYQVQ